MSRPVTKVRVRLTSAITNSSTTVSFTGVDVNRSVEGITMANFGTYGYLTVNPKGKIGNYAVIRFTGWSASGTTVTVSGISFMTFQGDDSSGTTVEFPAGTLAVISFNHNWINHVVRDEDNQTIAGVKTFSSSPIVPTGGTGTQAANATDIANAISGASGTATNSVFGTVKLSVAAASAPNPIVVGDNDTRVPTQSENDALAGTSGTPSSTNKYVTNDDTGTTGTSNVIRAKANGQIDDARLALTTAGDTVYSDGTDLQRLAIGTGRQKLGVSGSSPAWDSNYMQRLTIDNAPTAITNSSALTTITSFSLPANYLSTNNGVRIRLYYTSMNSNSGLADHTFILRYGSTNVVSLVINGTSNNSNGGVIEALLTSNGSTSSQKGLIQILGFPNSIVSSGSFPSNGVIGIDSGTSTEDSTGALTVSIQIQIANGGSDFVPILATYELIS